MNFFDHRDLGNHLLQLWPKVVKHPVYEKRVKEQKRQLHNATCYWILNSISALPLPLFYQGPSEGLLLTAER